MALRNTERCHSNCIISHLKLQINAKIISRQNKWVMCHPFQLSKLFHNTRIAFHNFDFTELLQEIQPPP